jgi:flagellar biosynthesis protein FlhF
MRLKSFSAPTMAQAMDLVRRQMGESAVIVSSTAATRDGQVRVTAAIDGDASAAATAPDDAPAEPAAGAGVTAVLSALHDHGAPIGVVDRLFDQIVDNDGADTASALAAALDRQFRFAPLALAAVNAKRDRGAKPIMLVGPPGGGKTVTAAKLATGAIMHRRPVELISADTTRAGATDQLAALAAILEATLKTAATPRALADVVAKGAPGALRLIDTAAVNPFLPRDMAALAELASAAGAEMVAVLPAGGDAFETADIAAAFADLGATRMIATRLDIARRYGGLLAGAAAPLAFAGAGVAPSIADGLIALDAQTLARLLLDRRAALVAATTLEAAQ